MVAVAWMAFTTIVFLFPATPNTSAADMNYTVVVLGGTITLSIIYYYFPNYGGVNWFKGPVPNIGDINSSDAYRNETKESNNS